MVSKEDTHLFNPLTLEKALQMLDSDSSLVDLSKHNCTLRPLAENDFDKSFGDVLAELAPIGDLDSHKFKKQFSRMKACQLYHSVVIEDNTSGKVVAAGVLLLDDKFYRCGTARGRIEQIIVAEKYRGRGFGLLILRVLTCIAEYKGCYRVGLESHGHTLKFYIDKCHFKEDGSIYMDMLFPDVIKDQL